MDEDAKELLGAIAEDLISATGFPVSTAKKIGKWYLPEWIFSNYFLKWDDLKFITSFYHGHNDLIKFPYNKKIYLLPQVLEIDNCNNIFSIEKIRLKISTDSYVLDKSIIGQTDAIFRRYHQNLKIRRKIIHEGQLGRLIKVEMKSNEIILELQPVSYEMVCRTNLCLDARERPNSSSLREVLHYNGHLDKLELSNFGNALGINFILFTADNRLVMPLRSRKVVVRPNQLSPSSSGDIQYSDIYGNNDTLKTVYLLRESIEELNIFDDHIENLEITFLGLTRELVRGGKPELFFSAKTSLTKKEFEELHSKAKDKWEFKSAKSGTWCFWQFDAHIFENTIKENKKYFIQNEFEKLLKNEGYRISVPLLTNLVLFLRMKLKENFMF